MKKAQIASYRELIKLKNILKRIQQLSWNVTQFNKRFPLENANSSSYSELKKAFLEFGEEVKDISQDFIQLQNEN